jgi:hypothetical protein
MTESLPSALPPSADWPAELVELLQRQQGIITRLEELATRQGELIREERSEPLLGLLGRRQSLIDEFTSLQGQFTNLTEDLDVKLTGVDADRRDHIRGLIDEISGGLDRVLKHDEEDQQTLQAVRDRLGRELASTGAEQQARKAYTTNPNPGSRFADRQG